MAKGNRFGTEEHSKELPILMVQHSSLESKAVSFPTCERVSSVLVHHLGDGSLSCTTGKEWIKEIPETAFSQSLNGFCLLKYSEFHFLKLYNNHSTLRHAIFLILFHNNFIPSACFLYFFSLIFITAVLNLIEFGASSCGALVLKLK